MRNLLISSGAMKAGTTWLYGVLQDHPEIHFTYEKELHYFANVCGIESQLKLERRIEKLNSLLSGLQITKPEQVPRTLRKIAWYGRYASGETVDDDWYENLFPKEFPGYCADFSNLYCRLPEAGWTRIKSMAENLKVIYTLRNPLQRLWSHYKFHMQFTTENLRLDEVGYQNFSNILKKEWFWDNAEYAKNYELLTSNLEPSQFKLMYFEDFRLDPREQVRELLQFLELEQIDVPEAILNRKINPSSETEMPAEWEALARENLIPVVKSCKRLGIWHHSW